MSHFQDKGLHLGTDAAGALVCLSLIEPGRVGWPPELRGLGHHPLCITALWPIIASDVRSDRGSKLRQFNRRLVFCTPARFTTIRGILRKRIGLYSSASWSGSSDPIGMHRRTPATGTRPQLLISSRDQVREQGLYHLDFLPPRSFHNPLPSRRSRKKATCFPFQYTVKKKPPVHFAFSRN